MTDEVTQQLLDRFVGALCALPSLIAVWAHGSLAGGDHRPGISDLDLIAVVAEPCTAAEEEQLAALHRDLATAFPSASALHCGYVVADTWGDHTRRHLTWAHEELMRRPVTAVTRCELLRFGKVLYGPPPAGLLPPVTDRQLADFVVDDLSSFWRPALDHPDRWLRDVWVDLGLLTLARAHVTLRTGRLITKSEALDVLRDLNAPADVVEDIRRRRYGPPAPAPAPAPWASRRAELTRVFLRRAIEDVVAGHRP
ncbi:nucleotidyltransferase domain-containing protein [Streptomyces sp. NPDC056161]|uniref:nucleotidyltransferase domain-containing protein n=1 Tax=Streptomyces sp. NPDC056161 TaxID=3345732 RepID=UPI0035DEADE5